MYENNLPQRRYDQTIRFLSKHLTPSTARLLDLGMDNPLGQQLAALGYNVENTGKDDLDDYIFDQSQTYDCVTAFEILEHLFNPYTILKNLPSQYLCATVPLQLWFNKPYRNLNDKRDQHFHEFFDWQFDALLEKTGWQVVDRKKWTNPTNKIGIRPILRQFVPRYYAVFAKRV